MVHAADEPTAVLDADMLRQAGLEDLSQVPDPKDLPPATPAAAETAPSIVIEPSVQGTKPQTVPAKGLAQLSWTATLAIAAALGSLVYLAIRFLR